MKKETLFVAFSTQKGGMGKTAMTVLAASYLHYRGGYESLFIRESNITARLGKTVYIRREFHDRIQKIVRIIGADEVSLFSYIDNLIAHHFEMFQDDITELYRQRNSNSIF